MAEKFYDAVTRFIFVEDQPQKADIIFVPGGNYPEAAMNAARLYKEGWAPFILPSGRYSILTGHFEGKQQSEWEYLKDILTEEGVPEAAVLKEDRATFTYENAIFSRRVTDQAGMNIRRAILSCQAFHARRALMYYQQQFPETDFFVCPVVTRGIAKDNWFLDLDKTNRVLAEVIRIGEQFHCCLPLKSAEENMQHPEQVLPLEDYRKMTRDRG